MGRLHKSMCLTWLEWMMMLLPDPNNQCSGQSFWEVQWRKGGVGGELFLSSETADWESLTPSITWECVSEKSHTQQKARKNCLNPGLGLTLSQIFNMGTISDMPLMILFNMVLHYVGCLSRNRSSKSQNFLFFMCCFRYKEIYTSKLPAQRSLRYPKINYFWTLMINLYPFI